MDRRELFTTTAAAASAAAMLVGGAIESSGQPAGQMRVIDTNASLFQWPFRRLPLDEVDSLVAKMRSLGVTQVWAGSFEGVLHRDVTGVNERLVEACRRHDELVAIGSIHLESPGWESDLRRCLETHKMPGVRVHPNYHGVSLADPRFVSMLHQTASAGRFVQIAVSMEDTRTQHPLVQVADVDLTPLPKLMRQVAGAKVQLLNDRGRSKLQTELLETPGVFFDCARLDGTDGIRNLIRSGGVGRVLLGTHAPFLIPEAALIRACESDLTEVELHSLLFKGAETLRGSSQ